MDGWQVRSSGVAGVGAVSNISWVFTSGVDVIQFVFPVGTFSKGPSYLE